jgi:Integrase core domain
MQNGRVESFNGRLRDECLNANWFSTMNEAKPKIETWRGEYNQERPHSDRLILRYDVGASQLRLAGTTGAGHYHVRDIQRIILV